MIRQLVCGVLRELREKGPTTPEQGICYNIVGIRWQEDFACAFSANGIHDTEVVHKLLQDLWMKWPHHSGNRTLPVPAPEGWRPPAGSLEDPHYDVYHSELDKWRGPYGELRMNLLNWSIAELSKVEGGN